MKLHTIVFAAATLLSSALLFAAPASAQATRTWVSGVGDDVNPCSRTAPCKTFAGAISKTAAGGEINCLDPGGFGGVTITKALTINCEYTEGGVLVSGTNAIIVNAGATDVVVLRGLDIFGLSTTSLNGVRFIAGSALHVIDCQIAGFKSSTAGQGNGILFAPSGANSELVVTDTIIHQNGAPGVGGGIFVQPTGTGSAKVTLDNVTLSNNNLGIRADGTGNAGVQVSVQGSTVAGNANAGIASFSPVGGPAVAVMINATDVSDNGVGINGNGANATLRIGYSVVTHNTTGASIQNGATVTSYGNNQIDDNAAAGPVLPITPLR